MAQSFRQYWCGWKQWIYFWNTSGHELLWKIFDVLEAVLRLVLEWKLLMYKRSGLVEFTDGETSKLISNHILLKTKPSEALISQNNLFLHPESSRREWRFSFVFQQHGTVYWATGASERLANLCPEATLHDGLGEVSCIGPAKFIILVYILKKNWSNRLQWFLFGSIPEVCNHIKLLNWQLH